MSITKKWKKIHLDLYKSTILLFRGSIDDFIELTKQTEYCNRIIPPEPDDEAATWDFGCTQIIYLSEDTEQGTIVHECLHVVFNLCRYLGIDKNDEEALCYMLEYIVDSM